MGQNQDLEVRARNDFARRMDRRDFLRLGEVREYLGVMEDAAKDARLVEPAVDEFRPMYENAPIFIPSRREFLVDSAILAGLIASGQLNMSCSAIQEPVVFQGKTYSNREPYMRGQDAIRGCQVLS